MTPARDPRFTELETELAAQPGRTWSPARLAARRRKRERELIERLLRALCPGREPKLRYEERVP